MQQRCRHGAAAVGIAGPKPSRFGCADGKLPVAPANWPVPPVISPGFCSFKVIMQLCGLIEKEVMSPPLLMRCMVPPGKTRSSRLTSGGSVVAMLASR